MKNLTLSIKTQLIIIFITISSIIIFVVTYFNFITIVDQEKNSFIQNSLIQANLLADFSISHKLVRAVAAGIGSQLARKVIQYFMAQFIDICKFTLDPIRNGVRRLFL